jgi:excisionase family DNA binding protein
MYHTPEEVASELQVTRRTVYEWLRSGRLRGVRAGRGWRIRPEDVASFLQSETPADGGKDAVDPLEEAPRPLPLEEFLALSPKALMKRNQAAREVLNSFLEEDEEEQRETWERLKQALDEDRLSFRKLFP